MKQEIDHIDESVVTLDSYNSDLNLVIDASKYSAQPLTKEGFAFMWAGARATHGADKEKICFEVKIIEHLDVSHLPADEPNPHVVRVGFSVDSTSMQLGEDPLSYGYGGTGKISTNCQFRDFGPPFAAGDSVLAVANMESDPVQIGFARNGNFLGWAYKVKKSELKGKALFPHVLTKNCSFEVNLGQRGEPYFKLPDAVKDFVFIACVPMDKRVAGTRPPEKREDCEMIMMCGLPGAGKSVWAADYSLKNPQKKYNVLGTNNIIDKMKVMGLPRKRNYHGRWDVLIQMATRCLNTMFSIGSKLRRNYILDQTNVYPTAQRRKMRNFDGFKRTSVVVVPSEAEYKRRCDKRDKEEGKEIPDHAVLEMKANFKIPEENDIFDKIIFTELKRDEAEKLVRQYNDEGKAATGPARKHFRSNEPMKDRSFDSGKGNFGFNKSESDFQGGYGGNQGNFGYGRGGLMDNFQGGSGGGGYGRSRFEDNQAGYGRSDYDSGYSDRGGYGGFQGGRGTFDNGRSGRGGFDSSRGGRGGFDSGRGGRGGFDSGRGGRGGFDSGRGGRGGFDSGRGGRGGFDSGRGGRGGFDSGRGGRGGYDNGQGGRGGYDSNRGGRGGYDSSSSGRGGYDSDRGGRGGYDSSQGGYDSGRSSYDSGRGGRGGYDSGRGGRGGFDSDRGGRGSFDNDRGGRGGFESERGGRGGFDSERGGRGGFDSDRGARGGFDSDRGGRGGFDSDRGGRGGFDSDRGGSSGYDSGRGGYNSDRGGRGGYSSDRGGRGGYSSDRGGRGGYGSDRGGRGGYDSNRGGRGGSDSSRGGRGGYDSGRGGRGGYDNNRGGKDSYDSSRRGGYNAGADSYGGYDKSSNYSQADQTTYGSGSGYSGAGRESNYSSSGYSYGGDNTTDRNYGSSTTDYNRGSSNTGYQRGGNQDNARGGSAYSKDSQGQSGYYNKDYGYNSGSYGDYSKVGSTADSYGSGTSTSYYSGSQSVKTEPTERYTGSNTDSSNKYTQGTGYTGRTSTRWDTAQPAATPAASYSTGTSATSYAYPTSDVSATSVPAKQTYDYQQGAAASVTQPWTGGQASTGVTSTGYASTGQAAWSQYGQPAASYQYYPTQ